SAGNNDVASPRHAGPAGLSLPGTCVTYGALHEDHGNGERGMQKYTRTAMAFHWLIAVAVLFMIGLGFWMGDIPRGTPERTFWFNLHKSIGLTIAILALIRLWWRTKHPPPPLPASVPGWQVQASR